MKYYIFQIKKIFLILNFSFLILNSLAQPCAQPIRVGGAATCCAGANSGKVFIDNETDSITVLSWYYSDDINNLNKWSQSSTGETFSYSNLSQTMYYRAYAFRKGCSQTYTPAITITVDQPSVGGNIAGANEACATYSGNLTLSGNRGNITAWQSKTDAANWTTIANTTTTQNLTNLAQTTTYRAVVKNGVCSADTSSTAIITINSYPVPDFSFSNVCFGNAMNFSDVSSVASPSYITGRSWLMGDGSATADMNPSHTYLSAGKYNVSLSITSDKNCTKSITKQVEVYFNPTADFSVNEVCLNDSTAFRDLSTTLSGTINNWQWTFGDLQTGTGAAPKHLYATAGSFNATLSVRTDNNCRHSVTKIVKVNANPVAAFEVDTVCLGIQSVFTNNSTSESGYISRSQWSFGDGSTSQQPYPSKTYAQAGLHLVRLIVETDKQCKDTVEHYAKVRVLPAADFSFSEACDGAVTNFQDLSVVNDDTIKSYSWQFGDGSFSVQKNPAKQYLNPQVYNVFLLVHSGFGCAHQVMKQVTVHKNPVADFMVENVCVGEHIQVTNISFINTNESLHYDWNLGDGNANQLNDFTHVYDNSGNYAISLKVTSSSGLCMDSIEKTVVVYALPNIDAGEDITTGRGMPVELSAKGGRYYNWFPAEFLNNSTIANPTATVGHDQVFVVQGEDLNGCVNTDTITVFVVDDQKVFPTNFITPDGNGKNDTWVIGNIEHYPDANIMIFDLNAQLIYNTTNYQNTWDGRNKNGDALPDGTYYYVISFNNDQRVYKGAITVMRKK